MIKVGSHDLPGNYVAEHLWRYLKVVACWGEELEREMAVRKESDASCLYETINGLKADLADKEKKLKDLEGLTPSLDEAEKARDATMKKVDEQEALHL